SSRSSTPHAPTRASSLAALARFGFVQWEFAGRLGPDPGRYVVRRFAGDEVRQVVVVGGVEAPPRRGRAPRPRRVAGADAKAVEVTRATVIDAAPLGELEDADRWLEHTVAVDAPGADALVLLNRTLAGYRVSSADPWL